MGRWLIPVFLALAVVSVAQRTAPSYRLLDRGSDPPTLLGVDAYFHVRMAQYSAENFPRQLRDDGAATFPRFGKQQASGLFNVAHGGITRVWSRLTGHSIRVAAYETGVWLPVVFSILVLAGVMLLATRIGGGLAGGVAGLFLVLYPGTWLARSAYGFLDQHVMETLLAVGVLLGLHVTVRRRGQWWIVTLASLPLALFFLSWLGSAVYFLHIFAFAALLLVGAPGQEVRASGVAMARFFMCAALWVLLALALDPDLVLEFRTGFRVQIILGLLTLGAACLLYGFWAARTRLRHPGRMALSLAFFVGVVIATLTLLDPVGDMVARAFRAQPPDVTEMEVTVRSVGLMYGPVLVLAVLAWVWHLRSRAPLLLASTAYSVLPLALWLASGDFDYVPPAFVAIYGAIGIPIAYRALPRRWFYGCGALLVIWPFAMGRSPFGIEDSREAFLLYDDAWYHGMTWLEENSVAPARAYNHPLQTEHDLVSGRFDYGVLTGWEYGNAVAELAGRSPVFARFPTVSEPRWFLSRGRLPEPDLSCPGCKAHQHVPYVVTDARLAADLFPIKVMRAQRLATPPAIPRDLSDPDHPVFGPIYSGARGVRLVMEPDRVAGLERVWASDSRSVLYWAWDVGQDVLERRIDLLTPNWRLPDQGTTRFYGVDTVHTVQVFRFNDWAPTDPDTLVSHSLWTPRSAIRPAEYRAVQVSSPIVPDGIVEEEAWAAVRWSEPFGDIVHGSATMPPLRTQMKIVWDRENLYVAARMEETHLWGSISDSTKAVWNENDFELFIDPDGDTHDYLEIEINAVNTRNQVHFPRARGDAGRSDRRAWFSGFVSAIRLDGTLNDHRDTDAGWSIEIVLPWAGFSRYGTDGLAPPSGDTWRMNFARVQWPLRPDSASTGYLKTGRRNEEIATWTPQGEFLMHVPEMYGYVRFDDNGPALADPEETFRWRARTCLLQTYYLGRAYRQITGRFAKSLADLYDADGISPDCGIMTFDRRANGFIVRLEDPSTGYTGSIDSRRHLSFPATDVLTVDLRPE